PQSEEKSQKIQMNQPQNISNQNQQIKPILISQKAGDGLWCQVREEQYNQIAEKIVQKKEKQYTSKIENEILQTLEKQCSELGQKLEKQIVIVQQRNIEITQMKKIIDNQNIQIQEQM
ncbi:hypothetical protein IMG5_092160, partial [Ichthyophthirius multifiliis]